MKVIAIYNIKGGVGKTASAVNLAYLASLDGSRTLLWDLDPQGAASFYFKVKAKIKGGSRKLVTGKSNVDDAIHHTDYPNLDLLPADFSNRNLDIFLDQTKKPEKRLQKVIKPLANDYNYVFLDCPPSISSVSESVFAAADILLIPTIPTTLSLQTFQQIMKFFSKENYDSLQLVPFFVMVDRRKQMHRLIVSKPPAMMSNVLESTIPYASEIERMGIHRSPVSTFAYHGKAAQSYVELWDELQSNIL